MNPLIDVIAFIGVVFGMLVAAIESPVGGVILIGASLPFPIIVEEEQR